MRRSFATSLVLAAAAALSSAGTALAGGGNYVFKGGTPFQQQQVRLALEASSFNWSVVSRQITINIAPTDGGEAIPGAIFLDPGLLDSGQFSWGVVQHEYAHEVDFELFDGATRARLNATLGGTAWSYGDSAARLAHGDYGCERFASTLAWAYWQSPANSMKPTSSGDESNAMAPAAFRALIGGLLGPAAAEVHAAPPPASVVTAAPVPPATAAAEHAPPTRLDPPKKGTRVRHARTRR